MKKDLTITLLYMAAILASNFIPSSGPSNLIMAHIADFLHIPMYALLTFFLIRTITVDKPTTVLIYAFSIAVAYGVLNEFVQAAVPGRHYSYADMFRNALGAGLVVFFYKMRTVQRTTS